MTFPDNTDDPTAEPINSQTQIVDLRADFLKDLLREVIEFAVHNIVSTTLTAQEKAVVEARILEDPQLSLEETAKKLKLETETVLKIEARAYKKLREVFLSSNLHTIYPPDAPIHNIVMLNAKIPLVVQGWQDKGLQNFSQLEDEIQLGGMVRLMSNGDIKRGLMDFMRGKFYRDPDKGATTEPSEYGFTPVFELACAAAGVLPENAFDKPAPAQLLSLGPRAVVPATLDLVRS